MQKPPGNSALRRGRFSQPDQIYMITTVTGQRRPVFNSLRAARIVVRALRHYHHRGSATTWCYVLMPDHLHWLVQLGNEFSLSALMRSLKSFTSRQINRALGDQGGPIWQTGFHDHAVRKEEDLRQLARYTIENPLRAGLVSSIAEYPHWDAWWFEPSASSPMGSSLFGLSD